MSSLFLSKVVVREEIMRGDVVPVYAEHSEALELSGVTIDKPLMVGLKFKCSVG